jgi:hypothetical protein
MWQHQAGRIDFDEPLLHLWERGWGFREYAPIIDARDGGCWAVIGVHGGARVRVDRSERREAWAEAVRLALMANVERRTILAASRSGTMVGRRMIRRPATRSAPRRPRCRGSTMGGGRTSPRGSVGMPMRS